MTNTNTLEARLVAALTAELTVAELTELLDEVTAAITEQDATARAEREKAFDPQLCPEPTAAHAAAENAAFAANRLRTLKPRLEARLAERHQEQRFDEWFDDFLTVESARDSLVGELLEVPEVVAKLVDLFGRIAANDAEITRLHLARPAGVGERVLNAELVARGLEDFVDSPSIIGKLVLFDFDGRKVWPPTQSIDPAAYTAPPSSIAHTDRWHETLAERQRQRAEENARVEKFYADQQRQREERENEERRSAQSR